MAGPRLGRAVAPAVGAGHHPAHPPAGLVRPALPGRAGRPADHGLLADQPVHHQHRAGLEPGQLHRDLHQLGLPGHHRPDGRDGGGGHRDGRRCRLPVRLLHGPDRVAQDPDGPVRGDPAAAVGELPGQGVLLAADLHARRAAGLEPGSDRRWPGPPDLHELGRVRGVLLPVAAVHDHPGVRGAGADPGLADRGVAGPGRADLADHVAGAAPARPAGHRGRVDLHVLADPRGLHHAAAGRRGERDLHGQRHLLEHRDRE